MWVYDNSVLLTFDTVYQHFGTLISSLHLFVNHHNVKVCLVIGLVA